MIWTAAIVDKGWNFGDVFHQEIHDANGWNLLLLVTALVHSARWMQGSSLFRVCVNWFVSTSSRRIAQIAHASEQP